MEKKQKKTLGEWWSERSKKQKYLIIGGVVFFGILGGINNDTPSACDCVGILNVPTEKVGIGMPLPIEHLSNEDFRKYEKCYDAYAGPATATLKCADSN